MERGLTQAALLASAPAVGAWERKRGYSAKAQRTPSQREGQIHPVHAIPLPKSSGRLGSKAGKPGSAPAMSFAARALTPAATVRDIQNLSGNQ